MIEYDTLTDSTCCFPPKTISSIIHNPDTMMKNSSDHVTDVPFSLAPLFIFPPLASCKLYPQLPGCFTSFLPAQAPGGVSNISYSLPTLPHWIATDRRGLNDLHLYVRPRMSVGHLREIDHGLQMANPIRNRNRKECRFN